VTFPVADMSKSCPSTRALTFAYPIRACAVCAPKAL